MVAARLATLHLSRKTYLDRQFAKDHEGPLVESARQDRGTGLRHRGRMYKAHLPPPRVQNSESIHSLPAKADIRSCQIELRLSCENRPRRETTCRRSGAEPQLDTTMETRESSSQLNVIVAVRFFPEYFCRLCAKEVNHLPNPEFINYSESEPASARFTVKTRLPCLIWAVAVEGSTGPGQSITK